MTYINDLLSMPALKALLLLLLAFIVASVARSLINKLLNRSKLNQALDKADEAAENQKGSASGYIGNLVYLVVFLLFVPAIFGALDVDYVAEPVLGMLNTLWGYLPNIIGASVVLSVGLIVAKLVRDLVGPALSKLGVDKIQESAGVEVADDARLSRVLAYVVYVLIVIPVAIVALQVLGISAISDPAVQMLSTVLAFLPNIFAAAAIVVVGGLIARVASSLVEKALGASGVDAKVADATDSKLAGFNVSKFAAGAVRVVVDVLFIVEALNVVQLGVLTNIGTAVIGYLPSVIAAVVVACIAAFAANAAAKALRANGLGAYAPVATVAIVAAGAFMVLSQLGVAPTIVNTAFIAIIAAAAVAAALAFGLGGRDFAARTLEKLEDATADAKKAVDVASEATEASEE